MTIYDITSEQLRLIEQLQENEGELTPELEEALNINAAEFDMKMEGYAMAIKNLESDIDGIKAELARLSQRKKSNEKAVERMKSAMLVALQVVKGGEKTKVGVFTFGTRRSEAVNVFDMEALDPEQFIIVKKEADKMAIKNALKAGVEVPGAELVTNTSLSIR